MKIYATPDVFDIGEVECRKKAQDRTLDDIKVFGGNLIDSEQVYLFIKEEDGTIVSTIIELKKLVAMTRELYKESKNETV